MSGPQDVKKNVPQRKKKETPEEAALRWQRWRRIAIFTVGGLIVAYYAWTYIFSGMFRGSGPGLPEDVAIEDIVAEFDADAAAAEKKYANKRIVVVGKLVVHTGGPKDPPETRGKVSIYYELPGGEEGNEKKVECRFYDTDDASTVQEGDAVRLSGVFKMVGPGKYLLDGASGDVP